MYRGTYYISTRRKYLKLISNAMLIIIEHKNNKVTVTSQVPINNKRKFGPLLFAGTKFSEISDLPDFHLIFVSTNIQIFNTFE